MLFSLSRRSDLDSLKFALSCCESPSFRFKLGLRREQNFFKASFFSNFVEKSSKILLLFHRSGIEGKRSIVVLSDRKDDRFNNTSPAWRLTVTIFLQAFRLRFDRYLDSNWMAFDETQLTTRYRFRDCRDASCTRE